MLFSPFLCGIFNFLCDKQLVHASNNESKDIVINYRDTLSKAHPRKIAGTGRREDFSA